MLKERVPQAGQRMLQLVEKFPRNAQNYYVQTWDILKKQQERRRRARAIARRMPQQTTQNKAPAHTNTELPSVALHKQADQPPTPELPQLTQAGGEPETLAGKVKRIAQQWPQDRQQDARAAAPGRAEAAEADAAAAAPNRTQGAAMLGTPDAQTRGNTPTYDGAQKPNEPATPPDWGNDSSDASDPRSRTRRSPDACPSQPPTPPEWTPAGPERLQEQVRRLASMTATARILGGTRQAAKQPSKRCKDPLDGKTSQQTAEVAHKKSPATSRALPRGRCRGGRGKTHHGTTVGAAQGRPRPLTTSTSELSDKRRADEGELREDFGRFLIRFGKSLRYRYETCHHIAQLLSILIQPFVRGTSEFHSSKN